MPSSPSDCASAVSSVKPYVFWPPLDKAVRDKIVAEIVQEVCELPDYNSPDDQPDLLQCRVGELEMIIHRALGGDP